MVDARFYTSAGERRISELLAAVGLQGLWPGDTLADRIVRGVSELETAREGDIVFLAKDGFADAVGSTAAGVILHAAEHAASVPKTATGIPCDAAQIVFSQLGAVLYPDAVQPWVTGIGTAPALEEGVKLGNNVSLGVGVEIGSGSVIGANSTIGPGVSIGRDCVIGSNCSIEFTQMGDGCVVLPGARLGTSGFGYLPHEGKLVPVPQLGRTILQDRVEIGANSVIDRGALGDTVIGEGTKIGNLVVIAHNCKIGRNCMLIGFIGLAGSVTLEDNVIMAGGGGTAGHITLGAGTTVLAAAWVSKSWPAGSRIGGAPAQDVQSYWAELAALRRLGKEQRQ